MITRAVGNACRARPFRASGWRARPVARLQRPASVASVWPVTQHYSTKGLVDEKIEEIQDLYAAAKDEFEMAMEETEKQTVYAEEDRSAAREELDKLSAAYQKIIEGPDTEMAEDVKRRVGQRIRELVAAVERMEEMAQNQD